MRVRVSYLIKLNKIMNKVRLEIKIEFIVGLVDIVLKELKQYSNINVIKTDEDCIYLDFIEDFHLFNNLRSVLRVFIIARNDKYNPYYLSKHKSVIGDIITMIKKDNDNFETFKIICAGAGSLEVRSIADYIQETHKLTEEEDDSDMKIHIVKRGHTWEIGIQISKVPLSIRGYRVENMEGAMNPTIAYALNSLCNLENIDSYLNIFSGSATLLIEAGQCYPNIKQLVGFDNSKENLTLAMKNIKEAGLIRKIKLKEADIFDKPELGGFDVICSDLPFGMLISKFEDLESLYRCFIDYAQDVLNDKGVLAIYTSKREIIKKVIRQSDFKIVKKINLKLITNNNTCLYPTILICRLKN